MLRSRLQVYYVGARRTSLSLDLGPTLLTTEPTEGTDLGVFPKFHGVLKGSNSFSLVMDIVPGAFDTGAGDVTLSDLLRVHNQTSHPFQPGERGTLVVRSIEPRGFQLIPDRAEQRGQGHIDVNV